VSAKSRAALVSVGSNSTLVLLKLAVGILSGSVSIISEAIHSANDLLAAVIAWFSVRTSDRAPDARHPYGHGKIEGISGAVEAALIVVAAIWIVYEAIGKIRHGGEVEHLGLGTAVMVFSGIVNVFVARYLFRVAKQEDSLALAADAHHLSTDVYTSIGVAAGLAVVLAGRTIIQTRALDIVDPIVAIAVALFILKIGIGLTIDAVDHLLDRGLPEDEQEAIRGILRAYPGVLEFHGLRTRKSGSQRYVDAHITMRGDATLREAHDAAVAIERQIAERLAPAQAVIHVDPVDVIPSDRRPA